HTASNFSGYSEARTARPAAAKAIPRGRRRAMTSAAPTPIEPNTIAFFQFCIGSPQAMRREAARNGLEQLRRPAVVCRILSCATVHRKRDWRERPLGSSRCRQKMLWGNQALDTWGQELWCARRDSNSRPIAPEDLPHDKSTT